MGIEMRIDCNGITGWISLLAEITFTAGRFWTLLHLSGLKSPSQKERKLLPMARKQFYQPRPR